MAGPLGKKLKDMTPEETRAYYREATARWRAKQPDYKQRMREQRLAKLAVETPEEREARKAKLNAHRATCRDRTAAVARAWRAANPEKAAATAKRYREKDIEASRAKGRAYEKANREKYRDRIRANNKKRRALKNGAMVGESVQHIIVAERDGWRCHICGKKVRRKDWSLDHLIPLVHGGEHSYRNVSLAHNLCNKRRWKGILPAQLRLFG